MTEKVALAFRDRNPDVLTSIANLSNDEVFTPPQFANLMLDQIEIAWAKANNGENIWSNPSVKFLDPFTKSGVFLREITRRLTGGLESEFPDLQTRVDHITSNQVFGIAITQLTALLARRSVYCSRKANSKHSISRAFDNEAGNIWFEQRHHTWVGGSTKVLTSDSEGKLIEKAIDGRCKHCGANQKEYDRGDGLDSYAYPFIHSVDPVALIHDVFGENMKFDVVVGNPPYQLGDGGGEGSSAVALYHRFVQQAIRLEPAMLSMVIPARWYSGGKGLDDFRSEMLGSRQISQIHDYPETDLCFPNVNIRGGVCYFLWEKAYDGDTEVWNYSSKRAPNSATRPLLLDGVDTFIRYNQATSIVDKVRALAEPTMDKLVRSRNPFGIPSNFTKFQTDPSDQVNTKLFRSRRGSTSDKEVYVDEKYIVSGKDLVMAKKVLVSKASPGGDEYPHAVIGRPFFADENSACTETYLVVSVVSSKAEAENLITYMKTKFFRFLVSQVKNTQNISKGCFSLVPLQDFSKSWTDELLFAKYGFSDDEVSFIDTLVRPMEPEDD